MAAARRRRRRLVKVSWSEGRVGNWRAVMYEYALGLGLKAAAAAAAAVCAWIGDEKGAATK